MPRFESTQSPPCPRCGGTVTVYNVDVAARTMNFQCLTHACPHHGTLPVRGWLMNGFQCAEAHHRGYPVRGGYHYRNKAASCMRTTIEMADHLTTYDPAIEGQAIKNMARIAFRYARFGVHQQEKEIVSHASRPATD